MSTINRVNGGTAACAGTGGTSTATLANRFGKLTTAALTTAAAATHVITLTNTEIRATDMVFASVALGTETTGEPIVSQITPAAGILVITLKNIAAAAAVNGTLVVSYGVPGVGRGLPFERNSREAGGSPPSPAATPSPARLALRAFFAGKGPLDLCIGGSSPSPRRGEVAQGPLCKGQWRDGEGIARS